MVTPTDYTNCYPITVSLDFDSGLVDPSMMMMAGQELVETCADLYPKSFIGGCGHLAHRTMTLFFVAQSDARDLRTNWYMARAKVLSKLARDMYSEDPDDIPW